MKGNPRSETEVVRSTYVISGNLCDFRSLCAFRNHVVSDFWARSEAKLAISLYTFRFLGIYFLKRDNFLTNNFWIYQILLIFT
jgi:hypothetical protein